MNFVVPEQGHVGKAIVMKNEDEMDAMGSTGL